MPETPSHIDQAASTESWAAPAEPAPDRLSIVIAAALICVLALPLALETAGVLTRSEPNLLGPFFTGDDLEALAVATEDSQGQNVVITIAARDLAAGEPVEMIYGPWDLTAISDLPEAYALGQYWPVLNPRLIRSFSGAFTKASYDPVLDDETIERFEQEGRIRAYSLSVEAVQGDAESSPVTVLHTDSEGSRLFVVPIELSPAEIDR